MTSSAATQPVSFPFEFAPQAAQDADLLRQLWFVPGLKELLMVRQVHALEHATVWVLGELTSSTSAQPDAAQLSGMSTERGFYLYGAVHREVLHRAVRLALQRLVDGEWHLAVHPRCGTNVSVGMLMTAGLAVGASLVLPKDPLGQLLGLGLAAATAANLAPDVGSLAQRYVTTAIPFNLAVDEIVHLGDRWGQPTHFVSVRWSE